MRAGAHRTRVQILDGRHWIVERAPGSSVMRLRRTPAPFERIADVEASLDDL